MEQYLYITQIEGSVYVKIKYKVESSDQTHKSNT